MRRLRIVFEGRGIISQWLFLKAWGVGVGGRLNAVLKYGGASNEKNQRPCFPSKTPTPQSRLPSFSAPLSGFSPLILSCWSSDSRMESAKEEDSKGGMEKMGKEGELLRCGTEVLLVQNRDRQKWLEE